MTLAIESALESKSTEVKIRESATNAQYIQTTKAMTLKTTQENYARKWISTWKQIHKVKIRE